MAKAFLKAFVNKQKDQIEKDKANIARQIAELKKNDPFADPDHASDNAAVDTDVREQVGHDTIEAQIKNLQRKLKDIDITLARIEKGRYGLCEKCGMQIPEARLRLIPEARFCVKDEQKLFQ